LSVASGRKSIVRHSPLVLERCTWLPPTMRHWTPPERATMLAVAAGARAKGVAPVTMTDSAALGTAGRSAPAAGAAAGGGGGAAAAA
jgi:hypothetical protein